MSRYIHVRDVIWNKYLMRRISYPPQYSVMFKLVILSFSFSCTILWCLFKIPTHMFESFCGGVCHCIIQLVKACVLLVLCLSTSAYYYVLPNTKAYMSWYTTYAFCVSSSILLCILERNRYSHTRTHVQPVECVFRWQLPFRFLYYL